jgi:hypothetical protein
MRRAIALGLVCAFAWGSVRSDEPVVYSLHIEAQPLDGALQELARQTGMQILFFSHLTEGRRSAALEGKYTMEAAMKILLSGSNLTYRLINPKTIQIVAVSAAPANIRRGPLFRRIDAAPCADRGHPHVTRR